MTHDDAQKRIARFIDDVVLPRANPLPGVPAELRGEWSSGDGWFSWIAVPSPITEKDLDAIEHNIGTTLPPLFRAYFLYKQILDGDCGIVRLPDMMPPAPIGNLKSQMAVFSDCRSRQHHALLPFANDGNDGGPICFKTDEPTTSGDYPIYFTDHERLADPTYSGERRWDSFEQLIDVLEVDILSHR